MWLAGGAEAREAEAADARWPGRVGREKQGINTGRGGAPFLEVKRHFGYAKIRYRGLAKSTERMALLLGLANLRRGQSLLAG